MRVVPSLRGMHGSVWSKNKFEHKEWQIEVSFRVTGKAVMGADGLVSKSQISCFCLLLVIHAY